MNSVKLNRLGSKNSKLHFKIYNEEYKTIYIYIYIKTALQLSWSHKDAADFLKGLYTSQTCDELFLFSGCIISNQTVL